MMQDAHESPELDLSSLLDLSQLPDDPLVLKQLLAQLLLLVRKETKRREEVERAIDALLRTCSAARRCRTARAKGGCSQRKRATRNSRRRRRAKNWTRPWPVR